MFPLRSRGRTFLTKSSPLFFILYTKFFILYTYLTMPKLDFISVFKKTILFLLIVFVVFASISYASDEDEKLDDLENKIQEYTEKIKEAQAKQQTLASTIAVLDNQIYLTTAQIQLKEKEIKNLEAEIEDLAKKIFQLENHLTSTSIILKQRIEETYKRMYLPSIHLMFVSDSFSNLLSRIKYLQSAQKHDKELMFTMEETKQNFDKQKQLKEEKQLELEKLQSQLKNQNQILVNQKAAKQNLLTVTKNDEKKFQQLLSKARAEYEAIQAIIAGRGDEEEVGEVNAGEKIASVIVGGSCNSSGTHLHFTVASGGNAQNPFSYLKSVDYENCSGSSCGEGGDAFNPSGSWEWPLSPKIRMNQGYGSTWAIQNTWVSSIYSFHNGIDIIGSSTNVKAVQSGTLFRGSYYGSGGCRLRYVRVDHKDSNLETFYLHVNY